MRRYSLALLALAALLGAFILWRQSMPSPREQPATPWPAIGQITYGSAKAGAAICTGALVAPDLVLTASHCLGLLTNKRIDPGTVNFAAGWDSGASVATRHGVEFLPSGVPGLEGDVALLVLDKPIPPEIAQPLALASVAAELGTTLTLLGYRRDAPERLMRDDDCRVLEIDPSLLGLSCPVASGNSGGPLLLQQDGTSRIVAVTVSESHEHGEVQAVAVIPGAALAAAIANR
jgi:protease YdgD